MKMLTVTTTMLLFCSMTLFAPEVSGIGTQTIDRDDGSWLDLNNNGEMDPYENPQLTPEERAADIVARLTLPEKISQMGASRSAAIERLGVVQHHWWNEALHGLAFCHTNATVFPQSIGLASSWNPELAREVATAISDEARALSANRGNTEYMSVFAPVVNIGRDPRWGRTQEGLGEDPYLAGIMGTAYVQGIQGDDEKYVKVIATPKHYAVNNEEFSRHFRSAEVDEKILREYYLPAFERCVTEGNAQSIMTAYNAVNGEPCSANELLLQQILRGEWGFDGYVVSDCGAIKDIFGQHNFRETPEEAAAVALKTGTDLNCGETYVGSLGNAINSGLVDEATMDIALERIFRARFRLGMFDPPQMVPYSNIPLTVIESEEHLALAKKEALETFVLLKNDNNLLPLSKDIKTLAVIGPNADVSRFGNYSGVPSHSVTPLEAIKQIVSNDTEVKYSMGAFVKERSLPIISEQQFRNYNENGTANGLKADYFNNLTLSGEPVLTRIDPCIDYTWSNESPDSTILPRDGYTVRWSGKLIPDKSERYLILANARDGIRLYINGEKMIDQWEDGSNSFITEQLTAGKEYDFVAEYRDVEGYSRAILMWKPVGVNPLDDAVNLAKESDAVILFMGTNQVLEGESNDRESLDLPENQKELIKEVYASNPNTCLILINGSPLSINWESENIPAILEAWFPGAEGGKALAEVLFGDYNPGGKLPMTLYTGVEQLPAFDDYDITKGRTYMYLREEPLYPFGYGLSYTEFEVSNQAIKKTELSEEDLIEVSFDIQNVGDMKGSEVVQLYVHEHSDSKYTAIKVLKAFERVFLEEGEKQRVSLKVPVRDLATYSLEEKAFVTNPGTYDIMVGNSSQSFYFQNEIIIN